MAPHSPTPQATVTLAPASPTSKVAHTTLYPQHPIYDTHPPATQNRSQTSPIRSVPPPQPITSSSKIRAHAAPIPIPTQAAAYASANQPKRERERERERSVTGKPIFDWITRKLAGRRATFSSPETGSRTNLPTTSQNRNKDAALPGLQPVSGSRQVSHLTPTQIFTPSTIPRDRSGSMARTESHSLRSYSISYANSSERDRRREMNNPYPSIPIPHRASTIDSESRAPSTSYFSRSRSPSDGSITSSMRPRISIADDGSSLRLAGRWADEDASVRPLPPSHPGSPTPSHSILSRSASASLLSTQASRRPPSPPIRVQTRQSTASSGFDQSFNSSEPDQSGDSRRDSNSTKPTTVLSFDSGPRIGHIAQVNSPSAASTPLQANHILLPAPIPVPSAQSTPGSTPVSSPVATTVNSPVSAAFPHSIQGQAPKHSQPHPRDNPHPLSPPGPNASTLTLASSNFAVRSPQPVNGGPSSPAQISIPTRVKDSSSPANQSRPGLATSPSVTWAPAPPTNPTGDSLSPIVTQAANSDKPVSLYDAYPPSAALSMSFRTGGWSGAPGGGYGRADRDASVRAVRRKGSWESYESGWSWRAAGALGHVAGDTNTRNRSSMLYPMDSDTSGGSNNVGLASPIKDKDLTPPLSVKNRAASSSSLTSKSVSLSRYSVGSASIPGMESPLGIADFNGSTTRNEGIIA